MRNLSYFYNLPWGNLIAKIWGILLSTYSMINKLRLGERNGI